MLTISKGDTFQTTLTFKKKGEAIDISNSTFVILIKKDGQDDQDALDMKTYIIGKDEGKGGEMEIKLNNLDERGEYCICVKALDGDDKYTVKEIPLTIK